MSLKLIVLAGASVLVFLFIFGLVVGAWVAASQTFDQPDLVEDDE